MRFHEKALQLFAVITGQTSMLLENDMLILSAGDGVEIAPGQKHQMRNNSTISLSFRHPSHGDKIIV